MSEQNEKQQINENEELNKPYDCRVTIWSKIKMISKIKERISSSKKQLNLFKNTPDLSKSVDSDILFDIDGRTLLLGRVSCRRVVFPKYLDGGIPPSVRRLFPDKLKKLEKNKDGELVQDKAAKGLDIRIFPQQLSLMDDESDAYTRKDGCGVTVGTKVSGEAMNDADMSAVVYIEETKLAREIVLENKVESLEAKVVKLQLDHDKMALFFENFKKIRPELVPLTPDAKEDPSDATIDGEHMDAVGPPDENEGPNEKSSIHHNAYSPPSSIPQIAYAPTVNQQQQQQPEFPSLDLGLTVLVFKQADDPIDAINHMMSFLSVVVKSRYPTTNNHLRNSSNPRQQATINDGEGHMSRQCTKPMRKRDESWFKDKVLLVQAHANGQILHEEELTFLTNPRITEDLNASLQEKVLVIIALKDALKTLKGKALADDTITSHSIDPKMLNVDVESLNPRLLNNRSAHFDYLKYTQEEAVILREIMERKTQNPLNAYLD
nr:hypothetical protein [Tanacetum cinerariifolium]